jgi:N-acetylmuramoyl-L-alanine amidase
VRLRFKRLLTGVVGVVGMCLFDGSPAKASARLQTWQFDTTQNRLFFSTESGVQPQVKLLNDPKRIVIDLPGIVSEDAIGDQLVGGIVKSVRVTQVDGATTRIVMALDANCDLDPQKIKVWGLTSQQWVVQLPSAQPCVEDAAVTADQAGAKAIDLFDPPPIPRARPADTGGAGDAADQTQLSDTVPAAQGSPLPPLLSRNQVSHASVSVTATRLSRVVATAEGFFLQTQGASPPLQVYRTRDANQNRQLVIDVMNAMIDPTLTGDSIPSGVYGVRRWTMTQFRTTPPAVRITMTLDQVSPDWQVIPLGQGGLMLAPVGMSARQIPNPPTTVVLPVIRSGPGAVTTPRSPAAGVGATLMTSPPQPMTTPPGPVVHRGRTPSPVTSSRAGTAPPPGLAQSTAPVRNPQPQRVIVMLDPGHGGADPGAVGIGGLQEKSVVMAVSQHVATILQQQGVMVQMTRRGDQTVDLQPRVDMAEAANATVFVSIHANAVAGQRPEVNGLETYYYSEAGLQLANILHRRVMGTVAMQDRGVKQARFFVLRRTSMPAALIEIGFVTGSADAPKLRNPTWQGQMGQAIATGILDYIRTRP